MASLRASAELAGATFALVVVLAYASSREAFIGVFDAILADDHLELVELEGSYSEAWDLDEKFWYALDTAESGDPSVMVIHTDTPLDAEDADMAIARAAAASGEAVQFRLVGDDSYYLGFPVDVSETWRSSTSSTPTSLHWTVTSPGRADCLMEAEVIEHSDTFMLEAIERRGDRPLNPEVPLDSHKSLLAALSERYPLVGLSDATMPGQVAVGRITRLGADKVTRRDVTPLGEWTTSKQHLHKDIEAIRFGHAYESALASVLS